MEQQLGSNTAPSGGAAAYNGHAQNINGNVEGPNVAGNYYDYRTIQVPSDDAAGSSTNHDVTSGGNRRSIFKRFRTWMRVRKLKRILRDKAENNCKLEDTTILKNSDRHAGYAPLRMAQYQHLKEQHPLDNLNRPTREEIMNSYESTTSENLQPEEFFVRSEELIRNSPEYKKAQNPKSKENVLNQLSNVVGVIGQAGVGKSTFVKVLLNRIIAPKKLYKAKFVFYAKLRDFHNHPELNIFEFLMGKKACEYIGWMKDEEVRKAVFEYLSKLDSVCILLDGLDEATIDTDTPMNDVKPCGKESAQKFILGLLSGQIFSKAKKIITSRPEQMLGLPDVYRPKFLVKIYGITQEGFRQICHNICEKHATEVETQIKNRPDLYSFAMVPIHCILMVYCIYQILNVSGGKPLPNNMTDVFVLSYYFFTQAENVCKKTNNIDVQKEKDLKNICSLAWSGIQNRQINFSDEDLEKHNLTPKAISSFAVTLKRLNNKSYVKIIECATENCTYFSHLLFQEFFAALYCLCFMSNATFHSTFFNSKESSSPKRMSGVIHENLTSNHLSMVTKFLFGLSNFETFKTLSESFEIRQQKEHVDSLKEFLKHEASNLNASDDNYFKDVLRVCSWAHENQDQNLVQQISDSLPDHIKMTGDILPSDVLSFHHLIKARSKKLCLDIEANFIGDASLMFGKQMGTILRSSSVLEMRINYTNNFNDEKAKHISNLIVDGVKEINLKRCDLTTSQINLIASQISKLRESIKLDLSGNKNMNLDGFKHLRKCLHNVCDLNLTGCDITIEEIAVLSYAISELKHQIKLDLSKNKNMKFDGNKNMKLDGFKHLGNCLHNVCELNLTRCDITTEEIELLSHAISELKHQIKLDLSGNKNMKLDGFKHLRKCLHNVCELNLSDCDISFSQCNITTEDLEVISQVISTLKDQLSVALTDEGSEIKLDLSGNKNMNLHCFKHLRKCFHNVCDLNLTGCDIKTEEIEVLSHAISELEHQITLDLSGNKNMNLDCFIHLRKCLHNVCELNLSDCDISFSHCDITTEEIEVISQVISTLKDPIKLDLSWNNNMKLDGFKHLRKCLNNVCDLNLTNCDITTEEIEVLSHAISELKHQIKLNLWWNKNMKLDGFKHLSKNLHNVCDLNLTNCDITNEKIVVLSHAISELKDQIKLILFGNKNMKLDGFKHLSKCLHNVCELNLQDCDITTEEIEVLSHAISELKHQMQCLDVSFNRLNDEEKEDFRKKCCGKISNLKV